MRTIYQKTLNSPFALTYSTISQEIVAIHKGKIA